MVGLVDLAPMKKKVSVREGEIEVMGIPARRIMDLLDRFEALRKMFAERRVSGEEIMKSGPELISAIIVEGMVGRKGNDEERKQVAEWQEDLIAGEQLDLILAIVEATFPTSKQGPFLERLDRLGLTGASGVTGRAQHMRSPTPSSGSSNLGGIAETMLSSAPPVNSKPGTQ